ncbi:hypothetical protein F5Y16DRAFT_405575 [Xylariaceae sp. FL0255]|nr:hypothetical protein F5Y16DRAFT_405575 [Xylariaceae sp. FL0255]
MNNGRATWIHLKANGEWQERIIEASRTFRRQYANYPRIQGSFETTLLTHIIMFDWCSENWHRYLNYWECELEKPLNEIRRASISGAEKVLRDVKSVIADQSSSKGPDIGINGLMSEKESTNQGSQAQD